MGDLLYTCKLICTFLGDLLYKLMCTFLGDLLFFVTMFLAEDLGFALSL